MVTTNICRQYTIKSETSLITVKFPYKINMANHSFSMYSCIRSPGTGNLYGLTKNGRKALLQFLLYRYAIGLYLPAMIISAVKAYMKEISSWLGCCKSNESAVVVRNVTFHKTFSCFERLDVKRIVL